MAGFDFQTSQQSLNSDDPRLELLSRIIKHLSNDFPVYVAPNGTGMFVVVPFRETLYPVELSVAGPMLVCVASHPQQLSDVDYLTVAQKINDANVGTVCVFFVHQGSLMSRMLTPLNDPEHVRASIVFGVMALHCLYKALFSDQSFMDILNDMIRQLKGAQNGGHSSDNVDSDS